MTILFFFKESPPSVPSLLMQPNHSIHRIDIQVPHQHLAPNFIINLNQQHSIGQDLLHQEAVVDKKQVTYTLSLRVEQHVIRSSTIFPLAKLSLVKALLYITIQMNTKIMFLLLHCSYSSFFQIPCLNQGIILKNDLLTPGPSFDATFHCRKIIFRFT